LLLFLQKNFIKNKKIYLKVALLLKSLCCSCSPPKLLKNFKISDFVTKKSQFQVKLTWRRDLFGYKIGEKSKLFNVFFCNFEGCKRGRFTKLFSSKGYLKEKERDGEKFVYVCVATAVSKYRTTIVSAGIRIIFNFT